MRYRVGGVALLWALASVGGCATLPTLVPDLATRSAAPVPVDGPRGPLSAARSAEIIARLQRGAPDTDLFTRHLAVEEAIVGSPLTTGNAVRLLQDGPATYSAMLGAIEAAQDHVHLETYIFDDDDVGRRFADLLIQKQQAGVQVAVIRDGVGTLGTGAGFFQRMTDGGIAVVEFNPVNPLDTRTKWELNSRDHRKLLVVDGRVAFMGGINISSVYSGGSAAKGMRARPAGALAWRDTHLELRGPVVAELQKLFLASWETAAGGPLAPRTLFPTGETAGRHVVRAIGSSPQEEFSQIYATLLSAIGSAATSVHLTNAYFVPDPQLLAALDAAAARGVSVRLVLPGESDSALVLHAGRSYYADLLRAGVRIYERHGAILHSKTALIDGVWATVGSTNLDWRSFLHNYELNVVVLGTEFGAELQAMFARDLAQSREITLETWQQRGVVPRIKESFARLWKYWL
jgi:cardiolipin synthase A/B